MTLFNKIRNRWNNKCGYKEVLVLALPLIISTGSFSLQLFVDRVFLTWVSQETVAASMPAGMLNFTIMSLFIGTAIYVSTFIAQYFGSKQLKNIGPIMWQGIYIAVIAGIIHLLIIPFAEDIFNFIGHGDLVRQKETIYFQILCIGALPLVASASMSGFFSGRGKTLTVMWVNIASTGVNVILDYILIFGKLGFPALGIKGAGIATVISSVIKLVIYIVLIYNKSNDKLYNVIKGWKINKELFLRLNKFGVPSGIQFCIEMLGFTIFILLVGRLGVVELAATTIAFNVNSLAFMPMIGFGIAISIMVGQNIGRKNIELAEYSVYSGFHLTGIYMLTLSLLYLFVPDIFLNPYALEAEYESFESIKNLSRVLLKFVAFYCVFDTLNIIFASAIKGAGDTKYVMYIISIASLCLLVLPSYIVINVLKMDIYASWYIITFYVIVLGFIFLMRFLNGQWKKMSVI
ncbi:MATE family efflux transporter [Spirochaetota bacterium]